MVGSFISVGMSICTNIGILLLLLLLWGSSNSCKSLAHASSRRSSNGTQEDWLALLAFKARITHDPFRVLSSWNDSISYCRWPGITCGGRRHPNRVRTLYLPSSGLVGTMAPEIGNLSFLREIRLQNNSFHDKDFTAHLGDFGISRIRSKVTCQSQNQTSSIGIKGSIGYIPPEYGAGASVSTHGDAYSYGILLLEMFTRKRPTDIMFMDNFNLHRWAERALFDGVMAIVDPSLIPMEEDDEEATITNVLGSQRCMNDRVQECLELIIRIGVTCSAETPWNRMDMSDVVKQLHLIRNIYLGVGTHQGS